jgi:glycosyltransferase involved in cell wall biosynthesis
MKKIRICYISRIHFASTRTHVHNVTRTSEALNACEEVSVRLVSTDVAPDVDVFLKQHGVTQPFAISGLGLTFPKPGRARLLVWLLWSNIRMGWFLFKNRSTYDVVYARDEGLVFAVLVGRLIGKPFFFESHSVLIGWHRQVFNELMVRMSSGLIAISKRLQRFYERLQSNSVVSYCGGEETPTADAPMSQHALRKHLGLPEGGFLAGYMGVLGENPNGDVYELDDVARSLALLPNEVMLVAVGERENDAEWLRHAARAAGVGDRVMVLPWQPRDTTPLFLNSFDAVVIPKRKKDMDSDSPLKMFSAMSAGRPIIGGQTEAITEVLTHGQNVLIVESNTPAGWAERIGMLYRDPALGKRLGDQAKHDARTYSWERRGSDIAAFVVRTLSSSRIS